MPFLFGLWTLLLCWLLPIGSLTAYVEEEEEKEEEAEMGMFSLDQTQGAAWRYGSFVAKVHGRWQVGMVAFLNTSGISGLLAEAKAAPGNSLSWPRASYAVCVFREQVAFAVRGAGGGPASYVALDDVFVREGSCSEPGEGRCRLTCSSFLSFRKKREYYGHSGGGEDSTRSGRGYSRVSSLLGKVVGGSQGHR